MVKYTIISKTGDREVAIGFATTEKEFRKFMRNRYKNFNVYDKIDEESIREIPYFEQKKYLILGKTDARFVEKVMEEDPGYIFTGAKTSIRELKNYYLIPFEDMSGVVLDNEKTES